MVSIQITIDGPAGAGKSSIAKILADRLNFLYIDTGAMYRAITYMAIKQGISLENKESLAQLANQTKIELVRGSEGKQQVWCDGIDVTEEIRDPLVSQNVSQVALYPGVRRELVLKQQQLAKNKDVVMDGRDAGTVVLPEADCKIFLTASLEERTRRRYLELQEKGYQETFEALRDELNTRDKLDENRLTSPLSPAPGARIINSTRMTRDEVVDFIMQIYQGKKGET